MPNNPRTISGYYHKRRVAGYCLACPMKLTYDNTSNYCLPCYTQYWVREQIRQLRRTYPLSVDQAIPRQLQLLSNMDIILSLEGSNNFPSKRLRHKVSMFKSPQDALLPSNIHWVDYNPKKARLCTTS